MEWMNLIQMALYPLLWAKIPWKNWNSPYSPQKSPKCSTWVKSQKRQEDLGLFPRKTFNIIVIQVYAPPTNAKEAEVDWFYEDL